MNKTVALKLMILVVIGTLATALNLSIGLQETIGISYWGEGRPLMSGLVGPLSHLK